MLPGYLFILSAATCWGLIGIFSSIAFVEGVSPMEVAFWRAVLSWVCFGIYALLRRELRIELKDLPLMVIFGLLGVSLFYVSYLYAVNLGGAAFASVLLYTAPAWVVICSFFFFREKFTLVKTFAVLSVILGVFLISRTGGSSGGNEIGIMAVLAGLTSGFCYSLYYTIGKYFSSRYSSPNLFVYVLLIGAVGIFPFVDFGPKSPTAWLALGAVSVISTFVAYYCYYQGVKHLEAGKASIVATLEPVVAAIAAYVVLGEYFSVIGYVGAMLIVGAVVVTIMENKINSLVKRDP